MPTIIIAHEFYDALLVHQFQKTPRGWYEKLIDIAEDSFDGLCFMLSQEPTIANKLYLTKHLKGLSPYEISHWSTLKFTLRLLNWQGISLRGFHQMVVGGNTNGTSFGFALHSYLYILLHALVVAPASSMFRVEQKILGAHLFYAQGIVWGFLNLLEP